LRSNFRQRRGAKRRYLTRQLAGRCLVELRCTTPGRIVRGKLAGRDEPFEAIGKML
jgi:hypothetical protein